MIRLPLLVIGGYLGAGKTTLIRHLLHNAGGLRFLVLVNDFGRINIDADLIASADGETIALSNGCVCCAMTGDLFYAIGDALDRTPRPDMLIIEASGVGDPSRIAAVARAEPDLRYAGIVTVADAESIGELLDDPLIGQQVAGQLTAADLVVLSRPDIASPKAAAVRIASLTPAMIVPAHHGDIDISLLTGLLPAVPTTTPVGDHGATFVKWSASVRGQMASNDLDRFLDDLPHGVFRLKGWVDLPDRTVEIHRVGARTSWSHMARREDCSLVAIAPSGRFDPAEVQGLWDLIPIIEQ